MREKMKRKIAKERPDEKTKSARTNKYFFFFFPQNVQQTSLCKAYAKCYLKKKSEIYN